MRELTELQRDVLDCVIERCEDTGVAPTRAEIAQRLGFKHQRSVDVALQALEKKRYVRLLAGKHRGIEVIRNY